MRRHTILPLVLLAAAFPAVVSPAGAQQPAAELDDPYVWLEQVDSPVALEWVEARNAVTVEALARHPAYRPIYNRTLQILDATDRIQMPSIVGDRLYNFWQDSANPRGVWRRTTWESYLGGTPEWEVLIDVDSLAAAEGVRWAWGGGPGCLPPEYRRCLVRLSPGGSDAVEIREFDVETRSFVDGGFRLPPAKQNATWIDRDNVLVATDFGEGTLTTSGYARIVKKWRRGTPLSAARTMYEAPASHVSASAGAVQTANRRYLIVHDSETFYRRTVHLLRGDTLVPIDVPRDADVRIAGDQLLVYLREPWTVGADTWPAASLISTPLDDFVAGRRDFQLVLAPGERETIRGISTTRDFVLVGMLNNVRGELRRYRRDDGRWTYESVPAPAMGTIGVASTSPFTNRYFFTYSGFTQPTTLYLSDENGTTREVRRLPERFAAHDLVVEQHEAVSRDGTSIPYFLVRHRNTPLDGLNPTLLYAYGGFEVSQTPSYATITGAAWLERGGVYVLANIRGGGEFGPAWHRAALRENRQRAYDDFIAVAENLVARRITSPRHLGIMGGSNGGLLVGVAVTQRPELFNAAVIQVPLLDMRRYHTLLAGASWMAEYGNPDVPEDWAFISRYSPYHNIRGGVSYPKVLFTTTTRDDRVHPAHARKMAARMEELGHRFYYFENTEGGHGSGVTNEQRAKILAITYAYLWERLARE